jgi:hypothetical protein
MILRFRCPPELKSELEAKASDEMTDVSAYMRRLLLQGLARDGIAVTRTRDLAAESHQTAA